MTGLGYTSIQAAVNASVANYTVYVMSNTMAPVGITNKTNLILVTHPVLGTRRALTNTNANTGLAIWNSVNVVVSNLAIYNWYNGMDLDGGYSNKILACEFRSNTASAFGAGGTGTWGNLVASNSFFGPNQNYAVYTSTGFHSNRIHSNRMESLAFNTIEIMGGRTNFLSHNFITNGQNYGINLNTGSADNVVWSNFIWDCANTGITTSGASNTLIYSNRISMNGNTAILLFNSPNSTIVLNQIHSNAGDGIRLNAAASFVDVMSNSIIGNTGAGIDSLSTNEFVFANTLGWNTTNIYSTGLSTTIASNRLFSNTGSYNLNLAGASSKLLSNQIWGSPNYGIYWAADNGFLRGNSIFDNSGEGLFMTGANSNFVVSNAFFGIQSPGARISSSGFNAFTSNTFQGAGVNAIGINHAPFAGYRADTNAFSNNVISGFTQIGFTNGGYDTRLVGNVITNNGWALASSNAEIILSNNFFGPRSFSNLPVAGPVPHVFWAVNSLGRNDDWLAPPPVGPVIATNGFGGVRVHWPSNTAVDATAYIVFRTTNADGYSNLGPSERIALISNVSVTNWVDPAPMAVWKYYVVAQDANGNESAYGTPATVTANGQVMFVAPWGVDANTGFGTNAAGALRSLHIAEMKSRSNGITNIWAASGAYTTGTGLPASGALWITNRTNLVFRGGYNSEFTGVIGQSLIDGTGVLKHGLAVSNCSNLEVSGFHVSRGLANGTGLDATGGGLLATRVWNSIFSNITASSNTANQLGGGISLTNLTNTSWLNVSVLSNRSALHGGGLCLQTSIGNILDIDLISNFAASNAGGALFGAFLTGPSTGSNAFVGLVSYNYCSNMGGGMYLDSDAESSRITNTTFLANVGRGYGGGLFTLACYSHIQAVFSNNYSSNSGGGIYVQNYANSNTFILTLLSNFARSGGGAFYSYNISNRSVIYGTNNRSQAWGGGVYLNIVTNHAFTGELVNGFATNGGGMYAWASKLVDVNMTLIGNQGVLEGGAFQGDALSNSIIVVNARNNSSINGGGVHFLNSISNTLSGAILGNVASSNGGGLAVFNSRNSFYTNLILGTNQASVYGGGLYVSNSTGSVFDVTAISNRATLANNWGGGAYVDIGSSSNTFQGKFISNNANNGGGMVLYRTVSNRVLADFVENVAYFYGGGLYASYGTNMVFQGNYHRNWAKEYGGGIYLGYQSNATLSGLVATNESYSNGGGAYLWDCRNMDISATFLSNRAASNGGGVLVQRGTNLHFTGTIQQNSAMDGGGLYLQDQCFSNAVDGSILGNTAVSNGGGLFLSNAHFTRVGALIQNNSSVYAGGGVALRNASSNTFVGLVASNECDNYGGGVYANLSPTNSFAGGVVSNVADNGGGAYLNNGYMNRWTGNVGSNTATYGGGIYLRFSRSNEITGAFAGNWGSNSGGALYLDNSHSNAFAATLSGNASMFGGAIFAETNTLSLFSGAMTGNTSVTNGGAISMKGSQTNSFTSSFSNNYTSNFGGAIYLNTGSWSNHFSGDFVGNASGKSGGAAYLVNNRFLRFTGRFLSNIAASSGGGVYVSSLNATNSFSGAFIGNGASNNGGAMYLYSNESQSLTGPFVGNWAATNGGALYFSDGFSNALTGGFTNNAAGNLGGAFYANGTANLFSSAPLVSNSAAFGGAVYLSGTMTNLVTGLLSNNYATNKGGGYYDYNSDRNTLTATVVDNRAGVQAGGIYLRNSTNFTLTNALISNNSAAILDVALMISNNTGMPNLVIASNRFAGTNGSSSFGIYEEGNPLSGHSLVSNGFYRLSLGNLYANTTGDVISNKEISVLNLPGSPRHDATPATANYVSPAYTMASNTVSGLTYGTIQSAVNAAVSGHEIWIMDLPGTEQVVLAGKTNLTLRTISAATNGSSITEKWVGADVGIALQVTNCKSIFVRGLEITGFSNGLQILDNSPDIQVMGSIFSNNTSAGLRSHSSGPSNRFVDNLFSGNDRGLMLTNGRFDLVISNRFISNAYGLETRAGASNVIAWNLFATNHRIGLLLTNAVSHFVMSNTLLSNGTNNTVNESSLTLVTTANSLIYSNAFIGSLNGLYFANTAAASSNNRVENNLFSSNQNHLYTGSSTSNHFLLNAFLGGMTGAFLQGSKENLERNTFTGVSTAVDLTLGNSFTVLQNSISGGITGMTLSGTWGSTFASNRIAGNATAGILADSSTRSNLFVSNALAGPGQSYGALFYNTPSNQFISNYFSSNTLGGFLTTNSTNLSFSWNVFDGNPRGFTNQGGNGLTLRYNLFTNHTTFALHSTVALDAVSNHFGNRSFSNLGVLGAAQVAPWLLALPGKNGDAVVPSGTTAIVASNGSPGAVLVHWGPPSAALDFSNYSIFASSNLGDYSNLGSSDIVTNIYAAGTTNITLFPPASATWNLWVTTRDTNGNESFYSPMASVAYAAPSMAASNSVTALNYASIQAAIDAATNNYSVFVSADTAVPVVVTGKTNLTLTKAPGFPGYPAISGSGSGTGLLVSNAAFVSVSNLLFNNWTNGVVLTNASSNTIANNLISSNLYAGIWLGGNSSANTLSFNAIDSNQANSILVYSGTFSNQVLSNTISRTKSTGNGIGMFSTTNNQVLGNLILSNGVGIYLNLASRGNLIAQNTLDSNQNFGITFWNGPTSNQVVSNWISRNVGNGLDLGNSTNNTLFGNTLVSNMADGISINTSSRGNTLSLNTIDSNQNVALRITTGASSNLVVSNLITRNKTGVDTVNLTSTTNNTLVGNTLLSNGGNGFMVSVQSTGNILTGNTIDSNQGNGISLPAGNSGNFILTNTITRTSGANNAILLTSTSNNTVVGNFILSNFNMGLNLQGGSYGNVVGQNTFDSNQNYAVSLTSGSSNLFQSNVFSRNKTQSIFVTTASNNQFIGNQLSSNSLHSFHFNGTSMGNLISGNWVDGAAQYGIYLQNGPFSNILSSNTISHGATTYAGIMLNGSSSNQVLGNALVSNASYGIQLFGASAGNLVYQNTMDSNQVAAIFLQNGPGSNRVVSNAITRTLAAAVSSVNATNNVFLSNFIAQNTSGVTNDNGYQVFNFNTVTNNGAAQFANTGSFTPNLVSNYFGRRTYSNMGITGNPAADPWLNAAPGGNADWVPPPAPVSLVVTNDAIGKLQFHWGPTSAAPDFSNYTVFGTTNSAFGYSNLTAAENFTNIYSVGMTNIAVTPPYSGTWYAWVTVRDTNGNESWYSPMASVVYTPPTMVASNSATAMAYATVQMAVQAATNNYAVQIFADVVESLLVDGRTNLTISGLSGRKVVSGTGGGIGIRLTNSASIMVSNLILSNFHTGIHGYQVADLVLFSNRLTGLTNGAVLSGASNLVLSNEVSGVTHGLTLLSGGNHLVAGNEVTGNFTGNGLALTNSASNRVVGNLLQNQTNGMVLFGAGSFSNAVDLNHIRGNRSYGLFLTTMAMSNRVFGNLIASNQVYGALLSSTPLNLLEGNTLIANTNAGLTLEGGFSNAIIGNDIRGPGQNFNIYLENGERSGFVSNNTLLNGTQWGLYLGSASNHLIFSNRISGNGTYGIEGAGATSQSNRIIGNYIHNNLGQGVSLGSGAHSTWILSNLLMNNSQYGIHLLTSAPHSILVQGNTVLSNSLGGVVVQSASNITVLSNRISGGNQPFGIRVSAGSAQAMIRSNVIHGNQTTGLSLQAVTNAVVEMNEVTGQPTGMTNDAGFGNVFRLNLSTNQTVNFASSTPTVAADSNWFGSRAWTNLKVFGTATNAPWLLRSPGTSGDFSSPAPPSTILVTNGLPGSLVLHWGPASAEPDFSNYTVFASSNFASFSNLTASEFVTNLFSSAATNVVLYPPSAPATWRLWVTALDTNGNESWYSPMASIVFTPPVYVASNTNTLTLYTSIQSAINAAGTNETVLVDQGNFEGGISLSGKTNLTLLALPWFSNNNSMGSVINGGGTNATGILLSNTVGSRIAGFTIGLHTNGIVVLGNSSNNLLDHNILLSNEVNGLRLSSDSADGNVIASNQFWGLNQDAGMDLFDGDMNLVISNRIGPNQSWGISMWGSTTGNRIVGNAIVSNASGGIANNNGFSQGNSFLSNGIWGLNQAYGIVLDAGDNNLVAANRIYSNQTSGIRVWNSGGHQISSNEIFNNGTHGVHLGNNNVQNLTVSSNSIWGGAQTFGIRLDDADNSLLALNTITSNKSAGVWLAGSATNNRATLNNLLGNPTNLMALDTNYYPTNYFGSSHLSVILSNVVNTNTTNALVPWRLGWVGISQPDVTAPVVPTGLAATPTPSNIALAWNDMSGSGAVSYRIYRSPLTNTFTNFYGAYASTVATSWTDTAPASNTVYHYFVTSLDNPGTAWSNESWFSPPVAAQMQDLTVPTMNLTNVAPFAWLTNATQSFAGWASNASVGLAGVLFGTNLSTLVPATGTTNWSLSVALGGLDGSTNIFALVASNANGLAATNFYTNRVDLTPPTLSFAFPYDNQSWGGVTNLSGTLGENPMDPITYAALEAISNGVVKTNMALPLVAGGWATNLDTSLLPSGLYSLRLTVSNQAGWTNRLFATNITISNFNGTLTWLQPTNGSILSGVTIMTGYVSAAQSGMFMSNTATGGWLPLTMSGGTNGSTNWNLAALPDGTNTLWVGATNQYGGWYGMGTVWVVVDHSPAVGMVTNIPADSFPPLLGGALNLLFAGHREDPESGVPKVVYHLSNSTGWNYATVASNYGSTSWSNVYGVIGYSDGPYWVWASLTNGVGLGTNTAAVRFFLNQYPPELAETNLTPFGWVTNVLDLRGTVTNRYAGFDPQTVSLYTNGVLASTGIGTNWSIALAALSLPAGTNVLTLKAVSTNFKTNTLLLTNRIDTTPPVLSWNGISDNVTISGSTNVNGTVAEMAEDPVTFLRLTLSTNGAVFSNMMLPAATGVWMTNLNIPSFPFGFYDLSLTVSNQAGLTNRITATNVLFNNFTGALAMVSPTNGAFLSGVTTLTGYVTSSFSGIFMSNTNSSGWQPFGMSSSNGSLALNTSNLNDGSNVLYFSATNLLGVHFGTTNVSVVVDNSSAALALTNPSAGAFLTTHSTFQLIGAQIQDPQSGFTGALLRLSNTSTSSYLSLVPDGNGGATNGWNVSALPEGPYWLWVEATNGVGLVSQTAQVQTWLNRKAPVFAETNTPAWSILTGVHSFRGRVTNEYPGYDNATVSLLTNGLHAGSAMGTNWSIALNTATVPDGTNLFVFRSISTNGYTNSLTLTNLVDNTPPGLRITNGPAAAVVYGTFSLYGTNFENFAQITGWDWSTNGSPWQSVAGNTNLPWSLTLDTLPLTNGPMDLQVRLSNHLGLAAISNFVFFVSNNLPTVAFSSPADLAYITNSNQVLSGNAASVPAPLTQVLFGASAGGPWAAPSGALPFTTNGPWGPFDRSTNTFTVLASNVLGGVSTNRRFVFELTAPGLSFVNPAGGQSLSNLVAISLGVDSYSPVTHLSLALRAGGATLWVTNLVSMIVGTNVAWTWDSSGQTNGTYDLVASLTNAAGWSRTASVTGLILTNTTPLVLTYVGITALSSNMTAGVASPATVTVYDQYTNVLLTNGAIPLFFAGLPLSPGGDVPHVGGLPQGSPVTASFTAGIATNIAVLVTRSGLQSLVLSPAFPATNVGPLPITAASAAPSPDRSFLSVQPIGGSLSIPLTNRVFVQDAFSNAVSTLPTFVFLRVEMSNVVRRDLTLGFVSSNEYQLVHTGLSNAGRYVVSAYFDGISEAERVKRDNGGASEGWVSLDLYAVSSSNLEVLIDRNKGGPTVARNPVSVGQDVDLFYRSSTGQTVTFVIYDLGGRVLRQSTQTSTQDGLQFLTVPTRDQKGRELPPGLYFVMMRGENPKVEKTFKLVITR